MRHLFISLTALCSSLLCSAQVNLVVDPRLELTGIVFHLGGAEEYAAGQPPRYAKDINSYFGQYKDHPLMAFIRELREEHSIGYNAIALSALALAMDGNRISMNPTIQKDTITFDSRWNIHIFRQYIGLLDDFCKKSDFKKFYDSHQEYYNQVYMAAEDLIGSVRFEWFEEFWGANLKPIDVYLSPASGRNNYAITTTEGEGLTDSDKPGVILSCSHIDAEGDIKFNYLDLKVLIHEFCHHFTHTVLERHGNELQPAADKIFPHVEKRLNKIGYGDAETMVCEWLNEVVVGMYLRQYEHNWLRYQIEWDENNGFVWMGKTMQFMDNFEENRSSYKTFHEFMPQLVDFFDGIAENHDSVMTDFENRHPFVISASPAQSTIVPTNEKQIVLKFSQSIYTGAKGVQTVNPETPIPYITEMNWSDDGMTYTLTIGKQMKANTTYGIRLPYQFFIDDKTGHRLKEDYILQFSTNDNK